jgi:hypothetical protein
VTDSPLPETKDDRYDHVRIRPRISYHPHELREPNGEKTLLKWILGIVSTLFISAVIGYWSQSMQSAEMFAEMRADIRNMKEQMAELKRLVEPRYRGGPPKE